MIIEDLVGTAAVSLKPNDINSPVFLGHYLLYISAPWGKVAPMQRPSVGRQTLFENVNLEHNINRLAHPVRFLGIFRRFFEAIAKHDV